jgi:homocysteine S-methyltransferase
MPSVSKYRHRLPQLEEGLFLSDGGLETTLVFLDGVDLPYFAAFDLLGHDSGIERLHRYYHDYLDIAGRSGLGFILETPTWRANPDWGSRMGYDAAGLEAANRRSVDLMAELRERFASAVRPCVISGNLGPRGDGYQPDRLMSADQARAYHGAQVETFAKTQADMVSAFTLNYVDEAVGIVRAARDAGMPVAISFTVETDGRLPTGDTLDAAIRRTDEQTDGYAAYFMVNCAHPTHLTAAWQAGGGWQDRIGGLRANASKRSHAELDACTDLDAGDPCELGREYAQLRQALPNLRVLGGCCGTDHRHVEAIAAACAGWGQATSTPRWSTGG